jgi:diguanylate cyclase (GGDEF)-like protein/PAS domain S-box-containing protein
MTVMINKTPEKATGDLTQDALGRSHNLLLALSRAAQSIQRARTAEEVYHAVGDQIKSLGGDVCLFMINADRQSLTVAHTSYAPGLIRRVEKLLRASIIGYRFALSPDSKYVRNITTGKTIYVQQAKKYVAATLPKDTYPVVDQFMSILNIEQGIFAPLRVDDETLGLMIVCGLSLSKSDVPAMESFAGQIAVSLHNVRLTQQMQNELSERRLAEAALRNSEERYRTLFDSMLDGIYRSTHDGKFVDVNPAMVKMFGYASREEMLAVDIENDLYFAPEERGSHILDTGREEIDIYRMKRKDGSEIWVEDHGYYVHDERGEILYHEGMLRDVTQRKQAEEELRESESQLRILFEQMAVGVARIETQTGRFVQINQKYCNIVGYSHEEMESMDFQSITYPQDLQADLDNMERLKSGEIRDFTMEKRYIHKNGSLVWVALTVSPMWTAGAVPNFHIAIVQDISARKATEAMLVKRAQQLATVTDVSAAISANLEQEQLLQSVVDLSKERFELYHAHIYLFDKAENALILKVGAGEVGRQMVLEGWRIPLYQERSLVARAARERIGVIANDVRRSTGFLSHPLLPNTRSEMAVPIIVGDSLFGVLDVQANHVNHFTEDDVRIMTTLAAQIAVAVQNALLFSEHKQVEEELRRAKESLEVVNMELRFAFENEQHMARTDTLTGINNRRNLFELAEHEFEVAKRYQQPLSIIMFDLDHFKRINDTYGHSIGDKMLEHVAQITHAQLRDVDIMGRYGGEEFVIVLPVTSAQKASQLAQRILEKVSAIRLHTDHGPATVTLSIGIAETVHEPQDETVENVIRRADEAMYAAKQAGRNRAVIFDAKQQ